MHPSYVEHKGCHFLFYGVIRKKVNCCVCSSLFPVYVYELKFGVSACYCQIEKSYGIVFFVCGVKFYVIVYFVCVCVDGVQVDFFVSYMPNMSPTYRTYSAMLFISRSCFIFASS